MVVLSVVLLSLAYCIFVVNDERFECTISHRRRQQIKNDDQNDPIIINLMLYLCAICVVSYCFFSFDFIKIHFFFRCLWDNRAMTMNGINGMGIEKEMNASVMGYGHIFNSIGLSGASGNNNKTISTQIDSSKTIFLFYLDVLGCVWNALHATMRRYEFLASNCLQTFWIFSSIRNRTD